MEDDEFRTPSDGDINKPAPNVLITTIIHTPIWMFFSY